MPTDFTFRLSTYLSLALACVCLGYAEWDLLPEVTVFTTGVIVLLVASFVTAGRFELDIRQANRVGMAVGVLAIVWVGWQFVRPSGGLIYVLPWPASLLPYLGPLLMVLMPAKLFRPKHAGDWWAMHGIGLVAVALATAITDDSTFGALVFVYAAAAVWGVSLLLLRTWSGAVPPVPGADPEAPPEVSSPARPRTNIGRAVGWLAGAAAVALPAFFASPPYPGAKWQLAVKAAETGLSADQFVDLNGGGDIRVNRDLSFEVLATYPDGRAKDDLSLETRFRAGAYNDYENGRWTLSRTNHLFRLQSVTRDPTGAGPNLGPGQFALEFRPTARLPRPVLAEPIAYRPGQPSPVVTLNLGRSSAWSQLPSDGSFIPLTVTDGRIGRYRQTTCESDEPDLGPPFELALPGPPLRGGAAEDAMLALTTARGVPRLKAWAADKLSELVRGGKLPRGVRDRLETNRISNEPTVAKEDYERVGRAFQTYFSTAREFRYELRLPRPTKDVDPTEDFVLNSKVGHCERFASALALSLRAVGVPAALVLGFKGCEPDGDGRYVVRQENAHAWVAILVPRKPPAWFPVPPPDPDGPVPPAAPEVWHWLSLDPTPGGGEDAATEPGVGSWAKSAQSSVYLFYTMYITGYNAERREEAVKAVRGHLAAYRWWYAAFGAGLLAAGVARSALGWRKARAAAAREPASGVPWYDTAVAALAAAGRPVRPGQTPREYATAVADDLRADPATAAVADIPGELVDALYRARFAARPATAAETAALTAAAARLEARLKAVRPPEVPRA